MRWKCDVSAIIEFGSLLVSQIQSIVREIASDKYKVGQVPVTISTFTNERKLYLSPGVNMRTTHPKELTDPVLPYPQKTTLEIKPGKWRASCYCPISKSTNNMCEAGLYSLTHLSNSWVRLSIIVTSF